MTEEQIVKKVSEILDVKYSHYDNHRMGLDSLQIDGLTSIPKIVCYPGMCPWSFAILEDMSVITLVSPFYRTLLESHEYFKSIGKEKDGSDERIKEIKIEFDKLKKAEKWLKDNNCAVVINNPTKKVQL